MRVTVYFRDNTVRDRLNQAHAFPQEYLKRRSENDRVLAIIEAPAGSRVRDWDRVHGGDLLLVPIRPGWWCRLFGPHYAIPVKYVIQEARRGVHRLRLIQYNEPASNPAQEIETGQGRGS